MNWEHETSTGVYFWGGILSNWAKSSFLADLPGERNVAFNCAEQYMMRVKAEMFKDYDAAQRVMATSNPRDQKAIGRSIRCYTDAAWDPVARTYTYLGVYAKFDQNKAMGAALLSTGNKILVEASPKDKKWGIGLDHHDLRAFDKAQWLGTNWLGHMLMKARDDLRAGRVPLLMEAIDWAPYEQWEGRST